MTKSGVTTSAGEPGCDVRGRAPHPIVSPPRLSHNPSGSRCIAQSVGALASQAFGILGSFFTNPLGLGGSAGWVNSTPLPPIRRAFNCHGTRCRWMSPVSVHSAFKQ